MLGATRRPPRPAAWLSALVVLLTCACSVPETAQPEPQVVSYAGAAGYLDSLAGAEADEQVRDWARLALASQLGLGGDRVVDALFDTAPLRDTALAGLAEQPTGPGRSLFDGQVLHVLVPDGDPQRPRTIGALLDQHRAAAGADAGQVQIHRYRVRPDERVVELTAEAPTPSGEARAANGWVERRVDQAQGLADLLATVDQLSLLDVRGAETWAGGWDLPGSAGGVTPEDVSVLQRGYRQTTGALPGFSLDPAPPATAADLRAAVPGLSPELAERVATNRWPGAGFASAAELHELVAGTLFENAPPAESLPARGLPADRAQLYALQNVLEGAPAYSQARYDGGLAGTEVGMTLFYTDYVAKDWTSGVGAGVPTRAVPGFVPATEDVTPPGLCPDGPQSESGRLWFGQNESAFGYRPGGVSIGGQATRLFFRADGGNGAEVEPSYRFGRPLRWWDRNYQAVADHEPQYHRLEDLMRWSGAIEWLATTGKGALQLPDTAVAADLRFADWYAGHAELRERGPLVLVTPPSAGGQEALLPVPSTTTEDCGFLHVSGGVSLADGISRRGGVPPVPGPRPGTARAWPDNPATTSVTPTGGRVDRVLPEGTTTYSLTRGPDGGSVRAEGEPSGAARFGDNRGDPGSRRSVEVQTRAAGKDLTFDQTVNGAHSATLDVVSVGPRTEITLRANPLGLVKTFLDRFRAGEPNPGPPMRYSYPTDAGSTIYRLDEGPSGGWVEVGPPSPTFRAGFGIVGRTADGQPLQARTGAPERLAKADLDNARAAERGTGTYGDVVDRFPPGTRFYRLDDPVAAEPASIPAVGIPRDTPVVFQTAEARSAGFTGSPLPPGAWRLVPPDDEDGGPGQPGDPNNAAGPGGPGPDGAGGSGGVAPPRYVPFVLVLPCDGDEAQQPVECG